METGRVTYAASTSWSAIHVRSRTRRPAPTASCPLINADDADLVRAVGRADHDLVADAVPDQRLAQGGLIAHAARLRVGFGGTDDAVGLLIRLAVFAEANRAAHGHEPRRAVAVLDQDVVLEDRLEVVDPGLDEALLVLGRVVLEVLRQVPELAGGLDLGGDRRPALAHKLVVLLAHRLQPFGRDVSVFSHQTEFRSVPPHFPLPPRRTGSGRGSFRIHSAP